MAATAVELQGAASSSSSLPSSASSHAAEDAAEDAAAAAPAIALHVPPNDATMPVLLSARSRTRSAGAAEQRLPVLHKPSTDVPSAPVTGGQPLAQSRQRSLSLGAVNAPVAADASPSAAAFAADAETRKGGGSGIFSQKLSKLTKRKSDRDEMELTPIKGTKIDEHHKNYVLMYDMLSGIRVTLSRCYAKPPRAVVPEDFQSAHKLAFDITGNELTPSSRYDFKFKDYAPWVFRSLREKFKIDAADYLVSLTGKYILSELGSPGKSGSFFYFSADYRFIIKTISNTEHAFFLQLLPRYYDHVQQNPNTLLARYYGLHRVKLPHGRKIHFVVMGNVFPPNRDIHETYDLKGSLFGRYTEPKKDGSPAILKDQNFIQLHRKLMLGPQKRDQFVDQIKRDSKFLADNNIMDYSLLLGIHDLTRGNKEELRARDLIMFEPAGAAAQRERDIDISKRERKQIKKAIKRSHPAALGPDNPLPEKLPQEQTISVFSQDDGGFQSTDENNHALSEIYYMGIIDILTPYDYKKRIEHAFKSLNHNEYEISAIEPVKYAERFANFLVDGTSGEPGSSSKGKGRRISTEADGPSSAGAASAEPSASTATPTTA